MTLAEAVAELETHGGPAGLAEALARDGDRGHRLSCSTCPLADRLSRLAGLAVGVGPTGLCLSVLYAAVRGNHADRHRLGPHACGFVKAFDGGEWPGLVCP